MQLTEAPGETKGPQSTRKQAIVERWKRRAITIPAAFLVFLALVACFPVLFPVVVVWDISTRAQFARTRALLFAAFHAFCESMGLLAAGALWLFSGVWLGVNKDWFLSANYALQRVWGTALANAAIELFRIRVEVEQHYIFGERPVLVFIRHSSYADTLLPVLLISRPYGARLRYILKYPLLWDPCLDVVGNRLPNHFVRHATGETAAELSRVASLAHNLGPDEGVLLYPEGTRFTEQKRARLMQRCIQRGDDAAWNRVQRLKYVLPPRLNGALALLDANEGADAVFVAHTGLENAVTQSALLQGGLIGAEVRVRMWGVPFEQIPKTKQERIAWLQAQWEQVDAFVAENLSADNPGERQNA